VVEAEVMLEGLVLLTEAAEQVALSWIWQDLTVRPVADIEELHAIESSFGGNHYGISPAVNLHGVTFTAMLPESA
jgi:methionyl-tRNA formyltransferase